MGNGSPEEIIRALLAARLHDLNERGEYLRGKCPQCGEKSLYVGKKFPYMLRCTRLNKCAFEQPVREALPDFFADFSRRFPPTEDNRHATADAYLAMDRGFDLGKIRGWYEQETHQVPHTTIFLPTVRFYLDAPRTRWWERLIGRSGKDGKGAKALFGGKKKDDNTLYRGEAWVPPGMTLEKLDRVFITEGIFHAIALHHAGYKAVAAFSANSFPHDFIAAHAKKGIKWTVAMDADGAGSRWAVKHHKRLKEMNELAAVCLPPKGQDWDDLWRAGRLDGRLITRQMYNGRLMLAETVEEKAYHYFMKNRREKFLLDFKNALYWIEMMEGFKESFVAAVEQWREDQPAVPYLPPTAQTSPTNTGPQEGTQPRSGSAEATALASSDSPSHMKDDEFDPSDAEAQLLRTPQGRQLFERFCGPTQISNVLPHCQYITRDTIMDEIRYLFRIDYANGTPAEVIPLEGTAITNASEFNKALLNRSLGGTFYGDAKHFKILRERWLNTRLVTVSALPFVGYDSATKAYIFRNHAWHNGRRLSVNEQGYFEINRAGVKTTLGSVNITTDGEFTPDWLGDYVKAFHWQGLALLAFWLGSLFVQQIRARDKSFPLFEFTGDPGAGKSTALEFCWKLVGRDDYEGFDLLKSTQAGRRRAFSQVSNLPVVIIESDRDNGEKDARQKQFGFDEVKPFFNGRGTGTLGVSKRGNETDESVFQASLIISQNAEVEGSEALLQRIVHCHADKKHHGQGTREIARWFERQTTAAVGGFLHTALSREREIMDAYAAAYAKHETIYTASDLRNERIIKNHAQVAACGDALAVVFGPHMTDDLKSGLTDYLLGRALAREKRLAADHPLVEQFWDVYDYITMQISRSGRTDKKYGEPLNHSRESNNIAINLNQIMEESRTWGQPAPDTALLKKLLPFCRRHKFLGCRATNSRITDKTLRCWVFSRQPAYSVTPDEF